MRGKREAADFAGEQGDLDFDEDMGRMNCLGFFAGLCILALVSTSCGTNRNTALSRNWQAFNSRYNVFYNGKEHYDETLDEMIRSYPDDYSRLLPIDPAIARLDPNLPQPSGDFKRTIEKMQKAIQLHSIKRKPAKRATSPGDKAFRSRDEFNPFLHNAWMLMGKAEYQDGDFLKAASIFLYVSRHFPWLPEVVTEARLWQARCYCALGWNYETENILRLIKPKNITDSRLQALFDTVTAHFLINTRQYGMAADYLAKIVGKARGVQKKRLFFLLGQLYALAREKEDAYKAFKKAASGMSTPYEIKLNARIKQSEVFSGTDIKGEIKSLESMARYERNRESLDKIYYAIGNIYLSRKDTLNAMESYRTAITKSYDTNIDKALAEIALGNIYFSQGRYTLAQPCYSEAIPLLPEGYPDYTDLRMRSDILDQMAVYHGNVILQDSLLSLSRLSEGEKLERCKALAEEYVRKEKAEKEAAERESRITETNGDTGGKASGTSPALPFQGNNDKSWYFYNPALVSTGKSEFQRRWGSRRLEDNWRRRNKDTFLLDSSADTSGENDSIQSADNGDLPAPAGDNNPRDPAFYLRQIPSTPSQIKASNEIIQESLYNLGIILKDRLSDYNAARREFNILNSRYPDNAYRLETYYNLFLMDVREDLPQDAEIWRKKILTDFPGSPYAKAMENPDYFNNLRHMHSIQEGIYQEAYEAYLANDNPEVHHLTDMMEKDYPLSPILPKFVFIDALSYLSDGDDVKFKSRLTELLRRWPETDMTDMASGILSRLNAGMTPSYGDSNVRGMDRAIPLLDHSLPEISDSTANFVEDPHSPHYVVFVFPTDSVNPNTVLFEVARFNFSTFSVRDFDLEPMRSKATGILVVKGFRNMEEGVKYRTAIEHSKTGLPSPLSTVIISKGKFEQLLREGRLYPKDEDTE